MRKIASNYVLLPGGKPVRNACVSVDGSGRISGISVRKDGRFEEIAGVEHYSGILMAGVVSSLRGHEGENIAEFAEKFYGKCSSEEMPCGVTVISGLDWENMEITPESAAATLVFPNEKCNFAG